VNPPCNRKSRSGNPPPTAGRALLLSQQARYAPLSYPTAGGRSAMVVPTATTTRSWNSRLTGQLVSGLPGSLARYTKFAFPSGNTPFSATTLNSTSAIYSWFGWCVFMQVSPASNQSVWKQVYQDALFEVDKTRLRPKLQAAMKAVEDRLFEVRSDPTDRYELRDLEHARRTIVFLGNHFI